MEVEKHEFIYLKMHREEAEKLLLLLDKVDSTMSNLPEWAKTAASALATKIRSV